MNPTDEELQYAAISAAMDAAATSPEPHSPEMRAYLVSLLTADPAELRKRIAGGAGKPAA